MPASTNAGSLFEMLKPRVRRTKKDKGVDPKAFLCNERTCFQWLNFMTVYSMFAIALSYKVRSPSPVLACRLGWCGMVRYFRQHTFTVQRLPHDVAVRVRNNGFQVFNTQDMTK
jgi:hypothetical protein